MLLTSESDLVRVTTTATPGIDVQANWADITTTTLTPGRTNTKISSATTTTIVGSPAASTQRQVKSIIIRNIHASDPNTVTVLHTDGTNSCDVYKITLAAGESAEYDGQKWQSYNASGVPTSSQSIASNAATVTVVDEAADTTCYPLFGTAASGSLEPKTNANLTFNASTGVLTSASLVATTADINGGTVDGATIGGTTAAAITGTTITANTGIVPDANDGAYLGTTALQFSDLFLAEGGVINFDNGDVTITQVNNTLTITGGSTIVDSIELGHATDTTLARVSAGVVSIEGNNILVSSGALGTPASGTVTNLTGTASININGTVGATTPAAGTFTTVTPNTSIILQENAPIILDPALSADGKYSGITMAGTAGAALAFGDLCYFAAADSRWELADADAEATAGPVKLGICVLAAAGDGSATTMLLYGNVRADTAFPALTISAPAYVSTTAGDIQVAAPSGASDIIRVVGWANTADELHFQPSGYWFEHA